MMIWLIHEMARSGFMENIIISQVLPYSILGANRHDQLKDADMMIKICFHMGRGKDWISWNMLWSPNTPLKWNRDFQNASKGHKHNNKLNDDKKQIKGALWWNVLLWMWFMFSSCTETILPCVDYWNICQNDMKNIMDEMKIQSAICF